MTELHGLGLRIHCEKVVTVALSYPKGCNEKMKGDSFFVFVLNRKFIYTPHFFYHTTPPSINRC